MQVPQEFIKRGPNPLEYGIFAQAFSSEEKEKIPLFTFLGPSAKKVSDYFVAERSYSNKIVVNIDSLSKFADWAMSTRHIETDEFNASMKTDDPDWSGSKSFEEAMKMLEDPDPEIIQKVNEKAKKAHLDYMSKEKAMFDVSRAETGEYIDVGLFMQGEPESFYQARDEFIPDKVLHLNVVSNYSAGVQSSEIIEALINLSAAILVLETKGYRVGINVVWTADYCRDDFSYFINHELKSPRGPLNIPKLVAVTHPSFFRRGIFRVQEMFRVATLGYGSPNIDFPVNSVRLENLIDKDNTQKVIDMIIKAQEQNKNDD